jgi:drug/metabolite transporter (DMT)-like permease
MGFLAVPVVGLAASSVMLGEPLTALDLAGALTTFLGIVLVSISSNSAARVRIATTDPVSGPVDS